MSNSKENLENIPRKVRVLWEVNGSYRKFYWFEMRDKDLYWGPSGKVTKKLVSQNIEENYNVKISIPSSISFDDKCYMKFSYHNSGIVHIKKETTNEIEYDEIYKWIPKEEINEPKRFLALISKTINNYEEYNKKLTKDDSNAIVYKLGPNDLEKRHYFEFFISPEGIYNPPQLLIKSKNEFTELLPITVSLNKDFILVIRQFIFEGLDDWHPDKEIFFITKDL